MENNEPNAIVSQDEKIDESIKENGPKHPINTPSIPVNFNFTDETAQEDEMNQVRDILASGEEISNEMTMDLPLLTVEEVAAFLKCTYDVQGWFTFPELWKRDPSFFTEIAIGILPNINAWAMRVPAVAHAVKTVSAAGSWGRLIWDMAGTWVLVVRKRQVEDEKKREEMEGNQNARYTTTNQPQSTNTTKLGKQPGFIIP